MVLTMPDNVWCISERARAPMKSFASNFGPEQCVWTFLDIREEASEEVARAPNIPRPKIPVKIDNLVIQIPIILMGRPIPSLESHEESPSVQRPSVQEMNPAVKTN